MAQRPSADRALVPLGLLLAIVVVIQLGAYFQFTRAFSAPHVTGLYSTNATGSVGFEWRPYFVCVVPLTQGWSLISLCANVTDTSIATTLSGIDYRYVMRWNTSNQSFDIYSPFSADPPFTTMEFNASYFVYLRSTSANIGMNGQLLNDLDIPQVQGWNGPGFPYTFNTTITRYFNGTQDRYLMKWDPVIQEFIIYSPRSATPQFTKILEGEGQLLNAWFNYVLHYNATFLAAP
jgi:hypothetical protein